MFYKKLLHFSICILLFFSSINIQLFAQMKAVNNLNAIQINFIYFSKVDSLIPLEEKFARMIAKPKLLGFSEAQYVIEGERSSIRIKISDTLHFTVKISHMGDPLKMIKLYKLDSQKGNREASISQGGPLGSFGSKKSKNGKSEIAFNVQKIGTDLYSINSIAKLMPGEYGFMNSFLMKSTDVNNTTYTFLAFGVDN